MRAIWRQSIVGEGFSPRHELNSNHLRITMKSTAPFAVFLLRISLGVLFLAHVGYKISVFTIPGFVGYFASLGLPAVAAYLTIALELLGGLALILGVYAPWIAIPLAVEMLGTVIMVHGRNGWIFTNKGGGWEYPMFWAVSLIVLFLLGDGKWALRPAVGNTSAS
jgi:putative oxidoreductase